MLRKSRLRQKNEFLIKRNVYVIELIPMRSCIFRGKDTKRYHKSFPIGSEGVFTIAYPV